MMPQPTPQQPQAAPWWQTLLVSIANLGMTIAAYHWLGPFGAGAAMTGGTAIAHAMSSPADKVR